MRGVKFVFLLGLTIFGGETFAQSVAESWVARYNANSNSLDEAVDLAVDNLGYVYVTGYSFSPSTGTGYDYVTIKYSPDGETLWTSRYNNPPTSFSELPVDLEIDDSGHVYVTGYSYESGNQYDIATVKYASNGDLIWVRRYNGTGDSTDIGVKLAVDDSGNVYLTGYSRGIGADYDFVTIRYTAIGDTVWVRRYDGPGGGDDYTADLLVDDSGHIYVAGYSTGTSSGFDYTLIKYSPSGDTLWVRRYNGPGNSADAIDDLDRDASGNLYVFGNSIGFGTAADYATIKYTPAGDTVWVRRYDAPGSSSELARAAKVDVDGNVYVTGYGDSLGGDEDFLTIKYAPNGSQLWLRRYQGLVSGSEDFARALAIDDSGNVYVTGRSGTSVSDWDYATIKYSPNGDSLWAIRYNGPDSAYDAPAAIYVDGNRNVYVTGYSVESDTSKEYATIKYSPCSAKPGDANASGTYTLSDVISIVNYIFNKPGCVPQPICWLSGLLCRGDWNASNSVTLADVIQAVNFVFNKPGGPWDALPTGVCCLL